MNENNKVVIYTSSLCGFCYKAKVLLSNYNIEFSEINIDNDYDKRKEMILKANGKTSVPQIFLGSEHIGGCDDLYELARENKLEIFNN
ncbi:glutaredoxin 3 [Alphaproteobacteria bacterium]|jgi:glutaredoxin 3|nr:glutaredoxin 3 [Alphaproteobacteria bacterium]MDB2700216.1 glutaredoxin 3 [Alphaproteobacteria bacterium]